MKNTYNLKGRGLSNPLSFFLFIFASICCVLIEVSTYYDAVRLLAKDVALVLLLDCKKVNKEASIVRHNTRLNKPMDWNY